MLIRFDPFRELDRLTSQVASTRPALPMDAYRDGEQFVVHFDLPGVDPGSIDLTVEKNVLTVTAERTWRRQDSQDVVVTERPHGRFSRQLFLGETLDANRIDAAYENGVLTLRIPVAEAAKPRKVEISVNGNGKAHAITAESSAA